VFAAGALDKLKHARISRIFVTDTVAITPSDWPDLEVISVAPLLAAAIRRLAEDGSLSQLVDHDQGPEL
jgi:ribose-phosphate pyrophosphokinase